MVTKMVANMGPWADIEPDETVRPGNFPNTNQYIVGTEQNGSGPPSTHFECGAFNHSMSGT
jgi:hypothetical protein